MRIPLICSWLLLSLLPAHEVWGNYLRTFDKIQTVIFATDGETFNVLDRSQTELNYRLKLKKGVVPTSQGIILFAEYGLFTENVIWLPQTFAFDHGIGDFFRGQKVETGQPCLIREIRVNGFDILYVIIESDPRNATRS